MSSKISAYIRLARLDKPVGIWLLFIPCLFGLLLAGAADPWLFGAFFVGSILMRSAGCVVNDIFDRKIDALVERTKLRPLASGELSLQEALIFLILLLAGSLGILITLPIIVIIMGFCIVPFVAAYPLMKRITFFPQVFLGITFNFGVLMGFAAATGTISIAALIMYVGCIFWTIGYDTIYAMQDIEDDLRVGVKSTAITFGERAQVFISGSFALFIGAFYVAARYAEIFSPLTLSALALCSIGFSLQAWKASKNNPQLCLFLFKMNVLLGAVLVSGLLPLS